MHFESNLLFVLEDPFGNKPALHIDGLGQDCGNSIANTLELEQSCAKSSIWGWFGTQQATSHYLNQ